MIDSRLFICVVRRLISASACAFWLEALTVASETALDRRSTSECMSSLAFLSFAASSDNLAIVASSSLALSLKSLCNWLSDSDNSLAIRSASASFSVFNLDSACALTRAVCNSSIFNADCLLASLNDSMSDSTLFNCSVNRSTSVCAASLACFSVSALLVASFNALASASERSLFSFSNCLIDSDN